MKSKLTLVIVGFMGTLLVGGGAIAGLVFSGNPGNCGQVVDTGSTQALPVLNKINRLIAGEVDRIELTDNELIVAFMERMDPRVKNFKIYLGEDQVGVSGETTNRVGLTVKFNVLAQVGFEKNYPQISGLELAVGIVSWRSGYIQKLINQRLSSFNFGRKFKIDVNPGTVTLEDYETD